MSIRTAESPQIRDALLTAGLRLPHRLTVAITHQCNLRCAHCWVESSPSGHPVPEAWVLDGMSAFADLGGREICLTGGEPFTHPRILALLDACLHRDELGTVVVQTNATLLTPDVVRQLAGLAPNKLHFEVSLDGARAATHERLRGAGTFARTLGGLETLVAHGFGPRTTLNCTETQYNIAELPELLDLVESLGLAAVRSGSVVAHGRADRPGRERAPPTPEQYVALVTRYRTDDDFRQRVDRLGRFTAIEWFKARGTRHGDRCTLVENPYLDSDGTLYPCVLFQSPPHGIPDVYHIGLGAALVAGCPLWSATLRTCRSRPETVVRCRTCPCLAQCAGGCAGRAIVTSGHLQSPEDRCKLRLAVWAAG